MAESIPFSIKGEIVGFSAIDVRPTGLNFYGPKGFFSPATVSKSFGYDEMADIELTVNRFGADNVTLHFKAPGELPFMFQTHGDAGQRIVAAVKELLRDAGQTPYCEI